MPLLAAGIGAAGSIGSGLIGSKSSKSAANKLSGAAQNAMSGVLGATKDAQSYVSGAQGKLNDLWAGEQSNLTPYLSAGTQGVNSLASAFAPGGTLTQQFAAPTAQQAAATPGEQFMLQQGTQAVDRSAAAHGGLNTGSMLQALTQYGQGLASTSYQQAYNNALNTFQTNHNNTLGGLLALTGVGQNATGQYNQASQNYGGNTLNAALDQGNFGVQGATTAGNYALTGAGAQAGGILGAGQAGINTLGALTNIASGNPGNIFGGGNGPSNLYSPTSVGPGVGQNLTLGSLGTYEG